MQTVFNRIDAWLEANGGHAGLSPRPHALRMLHEVVELCIACGCIEHDIQGAISFEIQKAYNKGELPENGVDYPEVDLNKFTEEVADVQILMHALCRYWNIQPLPAMYNKVGVLEGRQWEVDENGVLWRPGHAKTV